jgi:curli biogenesis system outer membrane secretion channel CsgG
MKQLAGITLLMAVSGAFASGQTKHSLAVDDFSWATVQTAVQSVFGTNVNIGTGINALMVKRIAQDGKFTVVERRKIGTVLKEQDFGASNRVKKGTQARVGEVRGADFTLMGDIVAFGRDDRRNSGGLVVGVPGAAGGAGGYKATDKAVVVLSYRLVDNETSEILTAGEARGESKRSSKGGFAGMFVGGVLVGGGFSSNASNFAETIIGEAVMDACDKLSQDLNQRGSEAASSAKTVDIDALVADVSGGTITVNAGSQAGIRMGQKLTVYHKGKEIKDPTTGEVLDVQVTPIGSLVITNVRDRISTGTYTGSPAQNGDVVRNE